MKKYEYAGIDVSTEKSAADVSGYAESRAGQAAENRANPG